ncbi:MAG: toprim domain-containing protein, partial [Tannerellaceae bacterium]|nr:toprim domain-containing protein [Tannerellaceae bacterium]
IYFKQSGKNYFALAFQNQSGGYEVRNRYFKGCIPPKDITIVCNESDECNVFEGFMDYLSYLTLKEENSPVLSPVEKVDHIILNSVLSLSKALKPLKEYRCVTCFFDHDKGGETAQKELKKHIPGLLDGSRLYQHFNDLNDYLRSRSLPASKRQIKPLKDVPRKPGSRRRLR